MKELSIKEKAKAYDEALERAKELLEVGLKDTRDKRVVLSFFPELAESEDERIRKDIISYLKSSTAVSPKTWIAWLEKQEDTNTLIQEAAEKSYVEGMRVERKHWIEKQGKQKPADNVEPKFKAEDIITPKDRGHEPWQIMQVDMLDKKYRFKDGYVIHFSQEDDYELVGQKHAWSDGDEVKINRIVACLENLNVADNDILLKDVDWLKSLKDRVQPQPQQQWKPTEEQMDALLYIFRHYAPTTTDKLAWDALQTLEFMLAQLKKIREE